MLTRRAPVTPLFLFLLRNLMSCLQDHTTDVLSLLFYAALNWRNSRGELGIKAQPSGEVSEQRHTPLKLQTETTQLLHGRPTLSLLPLAIAADDEISISVKLLKHLFPQRSKICSGASEHNTGTFFFKLKQASFDRTQTRACPPITVLFLSPLHHLGVCPSPPPTPPLVGLARAQYWLWSRSKCCNHDSSVSNHFGKGPFNNY